jgi:hypothetical protein
MRGIRVKKDQGKDNSSTVLALVLLHKQEATCYLPVFFQPSPSSKARQERNELALDPSRLEGVRSYTAACAATTFMHYTPPPFDGLSIALGINRCQGF